MSTYIEYDHPEEGLQKLEVQRPEEVAFDKITSLLRCVDPDDPKASFSAYFYLDVDEHARQHKHFMHELHLTESHLARARFNEYEDVLDIFGENLAWQVQAYPDGRIYGVMYVAGEIRNMQMQRQKSEQMQKSLGALSLID